MRRSAKERSWRKLRKPHSGGLDVRAFQQAGIPGHAYIGGVGHKRPYKRCKGYHMRRPTAGQIAGTRNTALASIRNKAGFSFSHLSLGLEFPLLLDHLINNRNRDPEDIISREVPPNIFPITVRSTAVSLIAKPKALVMRIERHVDTKTGNKL